MTAPWPKHPDGRNKRMGELTPEEQRDQLRIVCAQLQAEFDQPAVREMFTAILNGQKVQ